MIEKAAPVANIDLLLLAYNRNGILNYRNPSESGEEYLTSQWLPAFLVENGCERPVLFDVGAHEGNYSLLLDSNVEQATIYSFEPNPLTYARLSDNVDARPSIHPVNVGMGEKHTSTELFVRSENASSSHASIYADVLENQHAYNDIESVDVEIDTVDRFCQDHGIDKVHFAKIDTEGNELDVFRGAKHLIKDGKLWAAQFEFNEMNIISRVFLRDFYELLGDYRFFRLLPDRLMPLAYSSRHEIFQFQNILAVRKELSLPSVN